MYFYIKMYADMIIILIAKHVAEKNSKRFGKFPLDVKMNQLKSCQKSLNFLYSLLIITLKQFTTFYSIICLGNFWIIGPFNS